VPNPQARALVSGRSRTLGLLVSEITNPFFPELIQSFEDIAGENDFEVMVGSTNYNYERAKRFIKRLAQRRVEGVAVMTFVLNRTCSTSSLHRMFRWYRSM
jgi:DNA-binding LacI/PurR family transcriptional regulator